MAFAATRKICHKSLKEKYDALKDLEKGASNRSVAKKYNIPKNTLSTWVKNKHKIMSSLNGGNNPKSKKLRTGIHEKLDEAIFKWFLSARSQDVPIGGVVFKAKTLEYAKEIGLDDFQASDGWIRRWKKRYNISFKTISGEANSVTAGMVAPWKETSLPTLLSNYHLEDIYNADEFGLFYECLPSKSLHLKSEKCVGGKHSKVRLTGMAAANAVGDKLPMFIIGKSKKPRCFAGLTNLPCRYRGQGKSWMDRNLFEEWVRELDSKFLEDRRKIALLVDNCPAHPHVDNLKAIDLVFLPPNTTASTQPMDQGVIRSLKAKYRVLVVQKYIRALDRKMPLPKINIISAMSMLVTAWSMVTKTTVINCFTKANMSEALQEQALQDDDDPFKELIGEIDILREKDRDIVPLNVTVEDLVAVDDEVTATAPMAS